MTELHKKFVNILEENRLQNEVIQKLNEIFEDVKRTLFKPINKFNPKIYKGGSFAKGTTISNKYDLDIVLYFPYEIEMSEKEIYNMMTNLLRQKGYKSKRKYGVALQITYKNIELDIIPCKAIDNKFKFANAWDNKRQEKKRTSLAEHKTSVDNVRATVKLMKLWRQKNKLHCWHKMALEQSVIDGLKKQESNDLGDNFRKSILYLKSNIKSKKYIDPANSNNTIEVNEETRKMVLKASDMTYKLIKKKKYNEII